jgi:hypothetical protein
MLTEFDQKFKVSPVSPAYWGPTAPYRRLTEGRVELHGRGKLYLLEFERNANRFEGSRDAVVWALKGWIRQQCLLPRPERHALNLWEENGVVFLKPFPLDLAEFDYIRVNFKTGLDKQYFVNSSGLATRMCDYLDSVIARMVLEA